MVLLSVAGEAVVPAQRWVGGVERDVVWCQIARAGGVEDCGEGRSEADYGI